MADGTNVSPFSNSTRRPLCDDCLSIYPTGVPPTHGVHSQPPQPKPCLFRIRISKIDNSLFYIFFLGPFSRQIFSPERRLADIPTVYFSGDSVGGETVHLEGYTAASPRIRLRPLCHQNLPHVALRHLPSERYYRLYQSTNGSQ